MHTDAHRCKRGREAQANSFSSNGANSLRKLRIPNPPPVCMNPRASVVQPPLFFRSLRRGFSAVELLIVIGILVILMSIFVPYLLKIRETDHRVKCADNLRLIRASLTQYAMTNRGDYPSVIYDGVNHPNSYTCFTGPDGGNAFSKSSAVEPNDVTASLWLLIRLKLAFPEYFICPSTDDVADDLGDAGGQAVAVEQRGNFRGPVNLSYSYASPFSSAPGYKLNDTRAADFKLIADKNPGAAGEKSNAAGPPWDAPLLRLSIANSNNHGKAGQNVLFEDGHVEFETTPYCGVERDNIYTALAEKPPENPATFPKNARGVVSRHAGPAWESDSYLVPTTTDEIESPVAAATSQPSTNPATVPAIPPATSAPITPPIPRPQTTQGAPSSTTMPTTNPATQPMTTSAPATSPASQP